MPIDVQSLKGLFQRGSRAALHPLFNAKQLKETFAEPPKSYKALPQFYFDHLKKVFSDPKKLKLALTDITPLTILGLAGAIPAVGAVSRMMPHRKVQTITGGIGNILGGQLMQRTGLIGGSLGGLAGEALGRVIGSPFDRARVPDISTLAASMAAPRIHQAQNISEKMRDAIGVAKTGFEHEGIREPNPTTHDESIGGSSPYLADIPQQYGNNRSVANRGKWRPDIDTLVEAILVRPEGLNNLVGKDHAAGSSAGGQYNRIDGLHHDPLHPFDRGSQTPAGISGIPGKRIHDRALPAT